MLEVPAHLNTDVRPHGASTAFDIYRQRFESCRIFVAIRASKSFLGTRGFHRMLCVPMRRVLFAFLCSAAPAFWTTTLVEIVALVACAALQQPLSAVLTNIVCMRSKWYSENACGSFVLNSPHSRPAALRPPVVRGPEFERLFGDGFWSLCPRCKTTRNLGHTETRRTIKQPSATSRGQICLAYLGGCWQPGQSLGTWRTWLCSLQSIKWKL